MVQPSCLLLSIKLIVGSEDVIVSNAVLVLKSLVQSQLSSHPPSTLDPPCGSKAPLNIISRLAYRFDEVRHPSARACILWLVGQYAGRTEASVSLASIEGVTDWAPDTLRKVAKNFSREAGSI
jgi:AP-3 complex subunit beta